MYQVIADVVQAAPEPNSLALENPLTGFFSWNALGSYTGATTATMLIVRMIATADIPWIRKLPMVIEAYFIAAAILVCADIALPPPPTFASFTLCLINAAGVAITVIGGNAVLGLPTSHKPEQEASEKPAKRA